MKAETTVGGVLGALMAKRVKLPLPWERAAEFVTVQTWRCRTCRRWWGSDPYAEHMARYCCAPDRPCEECPTGRADKNRGRCEACRKRRDDEKWAKAYGKAVPWDGETPLCVWDDDTYLWGEDDVQQYIDDMLEDGGRFEDIRLQMTVPHKPSEFHGADYFHGDLHEDDDTDFRELDDLVNKWVKENLPELRYPGGPPVTLDSLRHFLREGGRDA